MSDLIVHDPNPATLTKWHGYSIEAEREANSVEITCDDEEQMAVDSLSKIKTYQKETELARKTEVEPFNVLVKRVNAMFKPISESLELAETIIKKKIGNYRVEKDKLRMELEAKRLAEFNARVAEEKAKGDQGRIVAPPVDIMPAASTTHGSIGAVSATKFWNYEVEDLHALYAARPDLVKLEPKAREILAAVAKGEKIAGLRVFEDMRVRAR